MLTYSELYDLEREKNKALSEDYNKLLARYESMVCNYLEGTDAFGTYLVEIHGFRSTWVNNTTGMKDYENSSNT